MKNKNRTERCDICCRKIFEEETIRIKIEVEDFESWEMKVCFDCWIRKEIEKKIQKLVDQLDELEFKGDKL